MNLKDWNQKQWEQIRREALGRDNRYFFWQKYGREGSDDELEIYYILNGGALKWRREHEDEKPSQDLS